MNTDTTTEHAPEVLALAKHLDLRYWIALTRQTRRFGHTYVHSGARAQSGHRAFEHGNIVFSFTGWGRSLNTGGHKYKVHARYTDSGKPVPSKILQNL